MSELQGHLFQLFPRQSRRSCWTSNNKGKLKSWYFVVVTSNGNSNFAPLFLEIIMANLLLTSCRMWNSADHHCCCLQSKGEAWHKNFAQDSRLFDLHNFLDQKDARRQIVDLPTTQHVRCCEEILVMPPSGTRILRRIWFCLHIMGILFEIRYLWVSSILVSCYCAEVLTLPFLKLLKICEFECWCRGVEFDLRSKSSSRKKIP